jgi:hypothetical protein
MKHIFTVHSPVTFLIAYAVIKKKRIPENDIIILSSGYRPPIELGYVKSAFQDINQNFFKKIKTWNTPVAYDKYINRLTEGEEFIAYIDLLAMYQRILITNPKCKSFNFIEEGSASYVKSVNLDEITHPFRKTPYRYTGFKNFLNGIKFILRGYSIRLLGMSYLPQSYGRFKKIKYYCLSEDAYPGVERDKKSILELNNKSDLIHEMAKNISLKNDFIWIEDSFAKSYGMHERFYKDAILSTIGYSKRKNLSSKIYLKLRPNQSKEDSLVYKCLLKENYEVEILNNEIIIEALLVNSQNCTVIGNVSSVLFYAPLLGHKSLSMFNKLNDKPKTAFDDFDIFWKNIIKF